MRTLLLGICIFIATSALAQRECASTVYIEQQKALDPSLNQKIITVEEFISNQPFAKMEGEGSAVIRIPVVVHVLYNKPSENISDAQILSQIKVLNEDFRRRNADTLKTPERFRHLAADVQIEFALATADPDGRATTGIIRKQTHITQFSTNDDIKFSAQGGDDGWDSRQYLNIWVGNFGTLLGYASAPGAAVKKDGIAINLTAFGTINVRAPYHLGRTTVHEIGHWLGLRHIWGDTYCGDDLVGDTPRQGNFTSGCPTSFRTTCNNGSTGDMYMNYMDYTSDACINLFTEGQKQRMLALFNTGGPRQALLSSKGLNTPWNYTEPEPEVEAPVVKTSFRLYPNPSFGTSTMDFEFDESWIGKTVYIINTNGVIVSPVQIKSQIQQLDIAALRPGVYYLRGINGDKKIMQKLVRL